MHDGVVMSRRHPPRMRGYRRVLVAVAVWQQSRTTSQNVEVCGGGKILGIIVHGTGVVRL